MNIKVKFITACILRDQCNISNELKEQINGLPTKAETVSLHIEQTELKRAVLALKEFMSSSENYHAETFKSVLQEIEYFASYTS